MFSGIEIDPSYGIMAGVRQGYNAPFLVVEELGESSVWMRYGAAKRLLEVLPELLLELEIEVDKALNA